MKSRTFDRAAAFAIGVTPTRPLAAMASTTSRERVESGGSPGMRHVLALAARVATVDSTVLITGESGVGKERVARFLHDQSPRRRGPFVAVNCGACAETLLDSELFGHARGAFTGAIRDHIGVFEAAYGGTLFLDEIGDSSPIMQVKLLRVVQERELRRVGEVTVRRLDVRLIAATHRDLRQEVALQRFRQDLYYRLCVVDLAVPPLRERPEDLEGLAREFLIRTATRLQRPITTYAPAALQRILRYPWPGNVRELEHAVERACALAHGPQIEVEDLPDVVGRETSAVGPLTISPLQRAVLAHRRAEVLATLERHQGHRGRAAQALGISVSTLKRTLRT